MSTKQKQEVGTVNLMICCIILLLAHLSRRGPILSFWLRKKDGSVRFCVDYRALNNCTKKCNYSLPKIDDGLDQLSGCGYLSTFNLKSGY